jgi:hypothetical protein
VYDRVAHLETTHDIWLKLCNTYEVSYEIKFSRRDTYNMQYQTFSQKPAESLDDCFARFESIVSSLRSCGPLAYSDNERAKQLVYALDDFAWGMKICALEEYADFATLDTKKLFSKLKSHELSRKGHPNHDASLSIKALITSARIGGHDANPINTTVSFALEFALSFLSAASDEQYESILDDEITLLARKFCALHRFRKERRRSPRGRFKCGDTTYFIADCPKRKKLNSSNKYNYTKWNDYSKGDDKKKYRFGDKKKKKKFQKMMSQACAALSDLDFSSDDSSSSEEDERHKRNTGDFTGLCLMGKSSRHISKEDLSQVEESAIKFTYRLGVGFDRHEDKGGKSAPKFIPSSTYHKEEATIKPTKAHYPSNPKLSFNPMRGVKRESPKLREEAFICMFCGRADHLDEFCFWRKKIDEAC